MNPIRNIAKAVIVKENKVLLVQRKTDFEEVYYTLPGGEQQSGETVTECLNRECYQEIGVNIDIKDLMFVREYIGKNHEFSDMHLEVHRMEFLFEVALKGELNSNSKIPHHVKQIGVEWIELDKLSQYKVYPKILKDVLVNRDRVYLGDIN